MGAPGAAVDTGLRVVKKVDGYKKGEKEFNKTNVASDILQVGKDIWGNVTGMSIGSRLAGGLSGEKAGGKKMNPLYIGEDAVSGFGKKEEREGFWDPKFWAD